LTRFQDTSVIRDLDTAYRGLLDATDRATSRKHYVELLSEISKLLVALRAEAIAVVPEVSGEMVPSPDFGKLIADVGMQTILQRRWRETQLCKNADAHLAATVMMGALLEAILLARLNSLSDKSLAFTARSAPRDRSGKVLGLRDWGLRDYIDVGHELGWITQSARDIGAILRDYRNYVHPAKEYSHAIEITGADAEMFWVISQSLTAQVLNSV